MSQQTLLNVLLNDYNEKITFAMTLRTNNVSKGNEARVVYHLEDYIQICSNCESI